MAQNETYQDIKNLAYFTIANTALLPSDWVDNTTLSSNAEKALYPYQATISNSKVTKSMIPDVIFDVSTISTYPLAPIAQTIDRGIIIYCKVKPGPFTIPTIVCYSSNGGELIT